MDLELHFLVLFVLHRTIVTNLQLPVAQTVAMKVVRDVGPPLTSLLRVPQAMSSETIVRDE